MGHENSNRIIQGRRMKNLLFIFLMTGSINGFAQDTIVPCCRVIDMEKEAGTFTIRDSRTGRISMFKPDALEGAELTIGDTVDVVYDIAKVSSVKGISRSYDLLPPVYGDSCCIVLKFDSVNNEPMIRVTAKNNVTGENIYFNLPADLGERIGEGSMVFTRPSHGYAMITAAAQTDTTQKIVYGFPMLAKKPDEQ